MNAPGARSHCWCSRLTRRRCSFEKASLPIITLNLGVLGAWSRVVNRIEKPLVARKQPGWAASRIQVCFYSLLWSLFFPFWLCHFRLGFNTGKHFNYLWIRSSDCIVAEALKIAVIKTISRLACAILSWTERGLMGHWVTHKPQVRQE